MRKSKEQELVEQLVSEIEGVKELEAEEKNLSKLADKIEEKQKKHPIRTAIKEMLISWARKLTFR